MSDSRNFTNTVMNISALIVAILLTFAFMFVTYTVMEKEIPSSNHDLIVFVLGFLTAQIGSVIQFYYGSSSATRKQGDMAASLVDTVSNLTPTAVDGKKTVPLAAGDTVTVKADEST